MPQWLAVGGVEGDEIAAAVAGEYELAGGREESARSAGAGDAREHMTPHRLAGLVVDPVQRARPRPDIADRLSGEPHRAARIGFGQVEDVEPVALVDVEEARLRRERRRRPVDHAPLD